MEKTATSSSSLKSPVRKILKWVALCCLGLLIALILIFVIARVSTYYENHIATPNGIDEETYVTLGGQEQYLLIRGQDVSNPVVIWLHGGPAGPDAYTTYVFEQQLTDSYTFVNWDQRGCGRTYFRNESNDPDNVTVTFEQTQADLDELIDYVCMRFNKDKVIIIGHSYGTAVGSCYVLSHPDKVTAYIGVGQLLSAEESETSSYENALQIARNSGDDTSSMEKAYQEYLADRTTESLLNLRSQTDQYHVSEKADNNSSWLTVKSPFFGFDDFRWMLKGMNTEEFLALNQNLFDYSMEIDVREYGLQYQVPVGFISGSEDWTTPVECTEEYFDSITAPEKQMELIDGCGHYPQYEDTEAFCNTLREMLDSFSSQG
ncbi:MAG: alpha/beta fold hydrolase [Coriobacteriales bacterium]